MSSVADHGDSRTPMIVAALGLKIERGPGDTVKLTQGDNETLLSREAWDRINSAVQPEKYAGGSCPYCKARGSLACSRCDIDDWPV